MKGRVKESIAYQEVSRKQKVWIEVSVDPFYSQENMNRLKNSVAQMESTGGTVHEVDLDE